MTTILVTGAAGTLGQAVVQRLLDHGSEVRAIVRSDNDSVDGAETIVVDLLTGHGLSDAMGGVDAVIHCATGFGPDATAECDVAELLLSAASGAGSPHMVYISIIGADRTSFPYFQAKTRVERLFEQSGLPFSILRATQFHGFVLGLIRSFESDGELRIPRGLAFQPIDVDEVAEALSRTALREPLGAVVEMAGPQILTLEEMAESYADSMGAIPVVSVDSSEDAAEFHDVFRSRNMVAPDRAVGQVNWSVFVERQHLLATPPALA
ncbi:uncharacterized protein YbjT (DUF2867 family) [Sphingomonas sp. UYAg733]